MRQPLRPGLLVLVLAVIATAWCVAMPFVWARTLSNRAGIPYWEMLSFYVPELAVASLVVLSVPLAIFQHRLSVAGLVAAAVAAPILKFTVGSPTYGVWPVSFILLAALSWRLHVLFSKSA